MDEIAIDRDFLLPPDHRNLDYLDLENCRLAITDGLILQTVVYTLETKLGKKVVPIGYFGGKVVELAHLSPIGIRGVKYSATDGKWKSDYLCLYTRSIGFAVEK